MDVDEPREAIPPRLREQVTRDLRPVRPLAAPWRRAAFLIPAAAIVLLSVPSVLGLRHDASILGISLSWGISALQMLAGIVLVGLAFVESVPGRALSARVLATALGAGIGLVLAVTLTTFLVSPGEPPGRLRELFFRYCFRHSALIGAPLVLVAGFLASRALPLRPWAAGALYGLGSGLMADAGWRLFCDVSAPEHVIAAHGGAILALMLLGMLAATAAERIRAWARRG